MDKYIGSKIIKVIRNIFISDYELLDKNNRDEMSDGITLIYFDDNSILSIVPNSLTRGLDFGNSSIPSSEYSMSVEVTTNKFWVNRLCKIEKVSKEIDPINNSVYEMHFIFNNGLKAVFEYNEERDALIIREN